MDGPTIVIIAVAVIEACIIVSMTRESIRTMDSHRKNIDEWRKDRDKNSDGWTREIAASAELRKRLADAHELVEDLGEITASKF